VKPLHLIFLGLFVINLGFASVGPIFAPLARELRLSEFQAGALISFASLAFALASPLWGRRSERVGRKPVFLVGLVGFAVGFLLFGFTAQLGLAGLLPVPLLFFLLAASRVLVGGFTSAAPVAAQAYVADTTSGRSRAAGVAMLSAANGLGLVLGPALAAGLVGFGLLVPYYAAAGLALLAALLLKWGLPRVGRISRAAAPPPLSPFDARVWPWLVVGFTVTLSLVSAQITVGFFIQDRLKLPPAGTAQAVGLTLLASGVALIAAQLGLIRALKWPPLRLLKLGVPLTLMSPLVTVLAPGLPLLALAYALLGFGVGLVLPGYVAGVSLSVGEREQGAAAGLTGLVQGLGAVVGPLLGTGLYALGIAVPYLVTAALLLGVTAFVWVYPAARAASPRSVP